MRPSKRDIIIATRSSRLATVQAEQIGQTLHRLNSRVGLRMVPMESEADRVRDHPLAKFGGKGLFTRAIELAVLEQRADIAVHSLKDLPTGPTPGLVLVANPRRAAVHDVLIAHSADRIEDLPQGATLGTSSPRRAAQALRLRPDLRVVAIRGNVETRINKVVREREFDATLLAAAGLERLGLAEHLGKPISLEKMLPAAGQGALGIQCRVDDHTTMRRCMPINHGPTATAITAERAVVEAIGADCHSPVAVLGQVIDHDTLRLRARVLSVDGVELLEADETMPLRQMKKLVAAVTGKLVDAGARRLLEEAAKRSQ